MRMAGPADFLPRDLVDLMDARQIEAAREKVRREYGTERAPTARRKRRDTATALLRRDLLARERAA